MTAQLMQRDERPFGITEGGERREGEGKTYLLENARIVHPIAVSWSAAAPPSCQRMGIYMRII